MKIWTNRNLSEMPAIENEFSIKGFKSNSYVCEKNTLCFNLKIISISVDLHVTEYHSSNVTVLVLFSALVIK